MQDQVVTPCPDCGSVTLHDCMCPQVPRWPVGGAMPGPEPAESTLMYGPGPLQYSVPLLPLTSRERFAMAALTGTAAISVGYQDVRAQMLVTAALSIADALIAELDRKT